MVRPPALHRALALTVGLLFAVAGLCSHTGLATSTQSHQVRATTTHHHSSSLSRANHDPDTNNDAPPSPLHAVVGGSDTHVETEHALDRTTRAIHFYRLTTVSYALRAPPGL